MRVNNGLTPQELEAYGISDVHDIVYNPSYDRVYQEELDPSLTGYERGVLTNLGAVAVDTGIFTGRSPKDKYIVRDDTTRDTFWWADKGKGKNDNKPLSPETWQHLKGLVTRQLSGKRLFVVDTFCGANEATRMRAIATPLSSSIFRCSFRKGRLFDKFPKSSNKALIVTPSLAFSANRVNNSLAIESLRKLKYSRWI